MFCSQKVILRHCHSTLFFGLRVPLSSILTPMLFKMCMKPEGEIMQRFGPDCQLFIFLVSIHWWQRTHEGSVLVLTVRLDIGQQTESRQDTGARNSGDLASCLGQHLIFVHSEQNQETLWDNSWYSPASECAHWDTRSWPGWNWILERIEPWPDPAGLHLCPYDKMKGNVPSH